MNVTGVSLGLFIVLLTILLLEWIRRPRPLVSRFRSHRSQRMCPSCGLITSRSSLHCLECGKRLAE